MMQTPNTGDGTFDSEHTQFPPAEPVEVLNTPILQEPMLVKPDSLINYSSEAGVQESQAPATQPSSGTQIWHLTFELCTNTNMTFRYFVFSALHISSGLSNASWRTLLRVLRFQQTLPTVMLVLFTLQCLTKAFTLRRVSLQHLRCLIHRTTTELLLNFQTSCYIRYHWTLTVIHWWWQALYFSMYYFGLEKFSFLAFFGVCSFMKRG